MKRVWQGALALLLVLSLSGCAALDVIGNAAPKAFEEIMNAFPGQVTKDDQRGGFVLEAPDGTARLIWSQDYSVTAPYDVWMETDLQPFVDAGLDVSKLPAGLANGDHIVVGADLGDAKPSYDGQATALSAFEMILKQQRERISFHAGMGHFGLTLTPGNMFEWAKDRITHPKDIVFVLDPQVFIDAGVAPDQVEGWVFTKVKLMEDNGRSFETDKFLKWFDSK